MNACKHKLILLFISRMFHMLSISRARMVRQNAINLLFCLFWVIVRDYASITKCKCTVPLLPIFYIYLYKVTLQTKVLKHSESFLSKRIHCGVLKHCMFIVVFSTLWCSVTKSLNLWPWQHWLCLATLLLSAWDNNTPSLPNQWIKICIHPKNACYFI